MSALLEYALYDLVCIGNFSELSLGGTSLKLGAGVDSSLILTLAVLIEVYLLRLNDVVGSNILLLDVSQIGLDANRVVTQFAQEIVTETT